MSKIIWIDAGHGGSDPGARGNGVGEAVWVLDLQKRIIAYLNKNYSGHTIRVSRSTDTFVNLATRARSASNAKADIFISLHNNAGGGTGFESFIYSGPVTSVTTSLQNTIHNEIMNSMKKYSRRDRGKKRQNFQVLRDTIGVPAVLLEYLFVDTVSDANLLKNQNFINDMARSTAIGIAKFLKLKSKGGNTQPVKPPTPSKPKEQTVSPLFKKDYEWAKKNNITDGSRPQDLTTRKHIWAFLHRLHQLFEKEGTSKVKTSSDMMKFVIDYGITDGSNENGNVTRLQIWMMMYRLNEVINTGKPFDLKNTPEIKPSDWSELARITTGGNENGTSPRQNTISMIYRYYNIKTLV